MSWLAARSSFNYYYIQKLDFHTNHISSLSSSGLRLLYLVLFTWSPVVTWAWLACLYSVYFHFPSCWSWDLCCSPPVSWNTLCLDLKTRRSCRLVGSVWLEWRGPEQVGQQAVWLTYWPLATTFTLLQRIFLQPSCSDTCST